MINDYAEIDFKPFVYTTTNFSFVLETVQRVTDWAVDIPMGAVRITTYRTAAGNDLISRIYFEDEADLITFKLMFTEVLTAHNTWYKHR